MRETYVVVCLALAGLVACGDNLQGNREPTATDSNVTTPEDTPVSITVNATDPEDEGLTFTFGSPAHGMITVSGGTVDYRPDDDYNGADSIHVDISDGTYEVSAELDITVTPVNDAPAAVDDTLAANEDSAATVTGAALVTNDTDVEDDALTVTAVGSPSMGTVALVGDTVTFTPPSNFTGTATFEYTVSDGAASDTGTVTVTVGGVNDPPVAVMDTLTTAEDTAGTITAAMLVSNDTDAENQTLSVTGVTNFTNGTATLSGGTITFTPAANFNGTAGFDYTVSDGAASATGHVTVTVTAVNDTPVASAQSVTVNEDATVTITLTGSDVENSNLTFAIATQPTAGSLGAITPVNGTSATVVYTPNPSSTAADSFTFTVNDGAATSTAATVSITVTPQNDAPVANATTATVNEDGSVVITVSGSDIDGDSLTFETVTGPTAGTLGTYTLVPPAMAMVTYTPNPNSTAGDSFTFRVNDGTVDSAPATVTITVTSQQDPPVADATTITTDEDTAVQITVTGSDLDGDALTFATGTGPAHGTLGAYTQLTPTSARVTYTPAANYNGPDSFTFTVNDGTTTSAAATVGVTVTPINDAPVAVDDTDSAAQNGVMVRDASVYTANDTDVDGPALSVSAVGTPVNGTVGLVGTTITFTPDSGFTGTASFEYTVTDGTTPDVGRVEVTVITNTPPVAVDDNATVAEDTALVITTATLVANDVDPDPQTLVVNAVGNAVNGTVALAAGNVTFTPAANYSGPASFEYTVFDGVVPDTGLVNVTVTPVNDLPVANADSFTVDEDSGATVLDVLANDTDVEGALTITSAIAVGAGTVTFTATNISFTPAANFAGPATVMYTVEDSDGAPANATVTITVTAINDLPVATNDGFTVDEDSAATVLDVLANDTDVEGALTITAVTQPASGTVTFTATSVSFTPNPDFHGTTTFTYTVADSDAATATATVTMTVTSINDTPVAQGQSQAMNENTVLTVTLTGTDVDVPGQQLTFAIATVPANGSLGTITTTGLTTATVTYTPVASFVGTDSFTFTASDGTATSAPATVSLTVNNVAVCNDGLVEAPETCDDQGNTSGDGCSATCQEEPGWDCTGTPSACDTICNDGIAIAGEEECDDGNLVDTDGCTTQCESGPLCTAATYPGSERAATDPATGHCYVSFDTEQTTFADAQAACLTTTGHLASITSASEQTVVASVQNTAENPWIGLTDELVEGSFGWITTEPLSYTNWGPSQPDGTAGDAEDCVALFSSTPGPAGTWNDTSCTFIGFTAGRICEIETSPCGNGTVNPGAGEACDDGNTNSFDGCSSTCQVEAGAVCSGTAPTTCSKLVINEIDYDQPGTDNSGGQFEFVEILNTGTASADLANIALILINNNSTPGVEYFDNGSTGAPNINRRLRLDTAGVPGNLLPPGGMIVLAPSGLTTPASVFRVNIAIPSGGSIFQNGGNPTPQVPDSVALFNVVTNTMIDSLVYEGTAATGTILSATGNPYTMNEGTGFLGGDPAPTNGPNEGLSRFPNGRDTQNNATDFALRPSTPGVAN